MQKFEYRCTGVRVGREVFLDCSGKVAAVLDRRDDTLYNDLSNERKRVDALGAVLKGGRRLENITIQLMADNSKTARRQAGLLTAHLPNLAGLRSLKLHTAGFSHHVGGGGAIMEQPWLAGLVARLPLLEDLDIMWLGAPDTTDALPDAIAALARLHSLRLACARLTPRWTDIRLASSSLELLWLVAVDVDDDCNDLPLESFLRTNGSALRELRIDGDECVATRSSSDGATLPIFECDRQD